MRHFQPLRHNPNTITKPASEADILSFDTMLPQSEHNSRQAVGTRHGDYQRVNQNMLKTMQSTLENAGKRAAKPLVGSNILALPFSEGLTPTGYDLPDQISVDQWLEAGRALGRVRGSVMWWVGDWWAFGEHRYGDRKATVEADDWEGPAYQTCMDAAVVCRAFTTYRRREVVSFSAHKEAAQLPPEWQDKVLDQGGTVREIRDAVKQTRAFLSQGWTPDQLDRKAQAEAGKCVVANMRNNADGRRIDDALLCWAEAEDRFERIDRKTDWGNPFEMPGDGDRDTVCTHFERLYWPYKPSLLKQTTALRGKVIGCWCHPEPCHGHTIAETVNRATGGKSAQEIADEIADRDA